MRNKFKNPINIINVLISVGILLQNQQNTKQEQLLLIMHVLRVGLLPLEQADSIQRLLEQEELSGYLRSLSLVLNYNPQTCYIAEAR